ncbi:hypothetical protein A7U60_g1599 [Sanghuangporus baumii]|uniref:Uncharacterized protein n=1 Tax=Sanghuangporus baumii TaxID=108892 RepID=A0A9Q5I4D8_SANBA|nr:hypothetical protein A7U60_g1599 [Sanghuangporus baumii]
MPLLKQDEEVDTDRTKVYTNPDMERTEALKEQVEGDEEAEAYLRDSGVAPFNERQQVEDDQRALEPAQGRRGRCKSRQHEGGSFTPPPSGALPPVPPSLPSGSRPTPLPPRNTQADRSYAELFTAFQRQQQVMTRMRAANDEHIRNEEGLRADLLAMTHRYLKAQATAEELEKRCNAAEQRAERLASQLEEEKQLTRRIGHSPESLLSPRMWHVEQESLVIRERQNDDRGDTATVSAGTVDSSEYVSIDLSSTSSLRPEVPPEEVLRLIRSINLQSLEVARACIASATFRPGVRKIQADNKMVVDLTEGIGCILVQMLRSRDHSKNKSVVELCLRTLLCYHVSKLIEDWPFHAQAKRKSRESDKDDLDEPSSADKEFSEGVESALRDIATILSLSGSPGQPSSIVRSHRDRIGSTLDSLLKTAENLACQMKDGCFEGPSSAEYSFLYARPGATFNKDLMHRHGAQQSMAIWKSSSKKSVQILCTREVGLARLHRTPVSPSSASTHSGSSGRGLPSPRKEIEVLSKVTVAFESDLDK